MRLYLDEDLAPAIAERLRRRGVDAVSAHDVGMTGVSDPAQLDHAASDARAVVTRNVRHFRALGDDRIRSQTPHAGIILCPSSLRGSVRLYLDEDLAPAIVERLRRRGVDAVSAHDVGMTGLSDPAQLDHAASDARAVVTRNVRHFRALGDDRIRSQTPHAGIILCPSSLRGSEYGVIVDALVQLTHRYPKGLGPYDVVFLTPRLSPR